MAGVNYLATDSNLASIESELEAFRASDQRRDEFVQRLVHYVKDLETKHRNLFDELENEQQARRAWHQKARACQEDLDRHTQNLNNECFTLALVDGDGAVFQDALVAAVAEGGSDAAHKLSTEIKSHLQSIDSSLTHLPLMVQMYTNVEGLSKKLLACGITKNIRDLYTFAQAFNMSQSFFSIVDVGSGKERADHKLKGKLASRYMLWDDAYVLQKPSGGTSTISNANISSWPASATTTATFRILTRIDMIKPPWIESACWRLCLASQDMRALGSGLFSAHQSSATRICQPDRASRYHHLNNHTLLLLHRLYQRFKAPTWDRPHPWPSSVLSRLPRMARRQAFPLTLQ